MNGRPWRPADDQPRWGDPGWQNPGWQQDEPNGGPQGQPGGGNGAPGYDGPGGYEGQHYDDPGYGGRWPGQPAGPAAAGPGPVHRPRGPVTGAMPQEPPGYDQRGRGPRPMPAGYGDGHRAGEDSFLPGFGGRDDFGGGRDGSRADHARGYPDEAGYDLGYEVQPGQRGDGARRRDGRDPAAFQDGRRFDDGRFGDGRPGGRGPGGHGPDPRGRDQRRSGRGDWDDGDPPRRRRGPLRRLAPWIALLIIFTPLVAGGLYVYGKYEAKYHPADYAGPGTGPAVTVQVVSGQTASGLAPALVQLGVVASSRAFTNAAEASANPAGLEPGFFTLNHHMQASLAYTALLNPKNRIQTGVTIPEGKRASQVILILAKYTKIPLKNFQQVIDHPAQLGLPPYAMGKVEGYLYPATYAIQPQETALQILAAMVARFNVEATQVNLPLAAAKVGLTPGQVITEASMAQAEGGSVSDFPKIAEVISNRLSIGMLLRFDSTVVYGLGRYATSATFAELAINTPYNTYMHAGLPIGPISNPGDAAIQAILNPDKGDLLFFLTVSGGKSEFSHTPLPGQ